MEFVKPQSPLLDKKSGKYFYPLTTIDQIIMDDNETRLNAEIVVVDKENAIIGDANPINAHTLGGFPSEDYVKKIDLLNEKNVKYDKQDLTEEEQAQAQENLGIPFGKYLSNELYWEGNTANLETYTSEYSGEILYKVSNNWCTLEEVSYGFNVNDILLNSSEEFIHMVRPSGVIELILTTTDIELHSAAVVAEDIFVPSSPSTSQGVVCCMIDNTAAQNLNLSPGTYLRQDIHSLKLFDKEIKKYPANHKIDSSLLSQDYRAFIKLWTNPDPGSAFEPQTINLDLSNYDMIAIQYNFGTNAENRFTSINFVPVNNLFVLMSSNGGNLLEGIRARTGEVTEYGVVFNVGSTTSNTTFNAACVPVAIYGIKGAMIL